MTKEDVKHIAPAMAIIIVLFSLTACGPVTEDGGRRLTIGLATNNPNGLRNVEGFRDKMAELGYVEGSNVTYVFAGGPTAGDELITLLEGMVRAKVDLIFTAGTPTGVAAHRITAGTNIPVVFGVIADPIAAGVLVDQTKPGGNVTGVRISENQARRLELLLNVAPGIRRVFVPYNPEDAAPVSAAAQIEELAPALGVEIVEAHARNDDEVTELLRNLPEEVDAIFLLPDSTVNARLADLVAITLDRKLPMSGPSMAQVEGGALIAYGIVHHEAGARAAHMADRILKGADPGNLPVETAELYLGVSLQTADAIGLEIPSELLRSAKVVVRPDESE